MQAALLYVGPDRSGNSVLRFVARLRYLRPELDGAKSQNFASAAKNAAMQRLGVGAD